MRGALVGLLAASGLALAEALLRYLPRLAETDLAAAPQLGIVAWLGYLLLAVPAGLLHPFAPAVVLPLLALTAGGDLAAIVIALAAGLLAVPAARHPTRSLPPLLLLSIGLLLLHRPPPTSTEPLPPSIVLVVLDTVSLQSTGDSTPTLSGLAEAGTAFTHAVSAAPWTVPSHAAMFTGRLPGELGCHHESPQLSEEATTIAERLSEAGYETGAFVANPWVGDFNGLTQGFGHQEHHWQRVRAARAFTMSALLPARPSKGGAATVRGALRWLSRPRDVPALAFVNLLEAHSPFQQAPDVSDPEGLGERMHRVQLGGPQVIEDFPREGEIVGAMALYAEAVRSVDALLAELVAGLGADTFLIVTSDHGEAFGEHGFYGHMVGLHPETLRVPLVIRGPDVPAGARVEAPVSTRAIHDTILAAAGLGSGGLLTAEQEAVIVSEQLRPLQVIADYAAATPPPSVEDLRELDHRARRVQRGAVALVREGSAVVRYDLSVDPGQRRPLPLRSEDAELSMLLEEGAVSTEVRPEMSADLRAQLRALGYLGDE
jgi:hypothetical protein